MEPMRNTDLAYLSKNSSLYKLKSNESQTILNGMVITFLMGLQVLGTVSYQIGANASQTISVRFGDFETKKMLMLWKHPT